MPIFSILKKADTGVGRFHGQNLLSCEKQSSQNMLRCKNSFCRVLSCDGLFLPMLGPHVLFRQLNLALSTTEQWLTRHPASRVGTWKQG